PRNDAASVPVQGRPRRAALRGDPRLLEDPPAEGRLSAPDDPSGGFAAAPRPGYHVPSLPRERGAARGRGMAGGPARGFVGGTPRACSRPRLRDGPPPPPRPPPPGAGGPRPRPRLPPRPGGRGAHPAPPPPPPRRPRHPRRPGRPRPVRRPDGRNLPPRGPRH